jgi:hypothetical protein
VNRDLLSPLGILDETPLAVRRIAAPWLGVLWMSSLALRLLQAHFFRELGHLSTQSRHYGDYLESLALANFLAFLPAVYGRAVFTRACFLGLGSGGPVRREAWKVPLPQLANTLYTSLLAEILFYLFLWSFVSIPVFAVAGGLGVVAAHRVARPGLFAPLREIVHLASNVKVLGALVFIFGVALCLGFINVYMIFRLGLWMLEGAQGSDAAWWQHLLRPNPFFPVVPAESLPFWISAAGAVFFVEPFWLASLAVYAHRSELRQTGEDLRLWFGELRRGNG